MKEKIKCPFCDKSDIGVEYTPLTKRKNLQKCRAGSGGIKYSKERYIVLEDCPNCGATSTKIEKTLNSGEEYKKPSREKVLERMRKAGISTKF